jgi:hypothetical protein
MEDFGVPLCALLGSGTSRGENRCIGLPCP